MKQGHTNQTNNQTEGGKMKEFNIKKKNFTATHGDGTKHVWKFFRDGGYWYLEDYTGYVRTMEKTWIDSLPKMRLCVENHGMEFTLS
jgi:hypothetical protein